MIYLKVSRNSILEGLRIVIGGHYPSIIALKDYEEALELHRELWLENIDDNQLDYTAKLSSGQYTWSNQTWNSILNCLNEWFIDAEDLIVNSQ
jgi:hypothetical protein